MHDRHRIAEGMDREADNAAGSCERVIDAITRGILSGRYVPGQRLVEADLTQVLRMSRGPVREALKRLDGEGVLTLTRHRGALVKLLSRQEIRDLLVVVETLTGLIVRLAADAVARATAQQRRRYGDWLQVYREKRLTQAELFERRRQFYDMLITMGGNSQLPSVMPTMRIHLIRMQLQPFLGPDDLQTRLDEYAAISNAVLAGDARLAERQMQRHVARMREAMNSMPDEAFAPEQPARLAQDVSRTFTARHRRARKNAKGHSRNSA